MVHAQDLHAGDFVDQRFQHRACQLNQLVPGLLDEIAAFVRRQRFAELSFGERQDAENVTNNMSLL